MSTKHLINTLSEVIKVVDNLKAIKKIEEYTELKSNITFKGEDTGTCYRHINNIINGRERRFTAGGYYWFKAELGFDEVQKKILEIKNSKYQGLIGNNNRNLKKSSVF